MQLLADIAPRQLGRGMAASYTHELVLTFPHGDQVASGPAPAGYKPQVFDFTPIVVNPGAAASSKAAKAREKQNNKSDVMHALRVVAEGYRRSSRGDPDSETPPFAKIVVSAAHLTAADFSSTRAPPHASMPLWLGALPQRRASARLAPMHLPRARARPPPHSGRARGGRGRGVDSPIQ